MRPWGRAAGVFALVVALDQATKAVVVATVDRGERDGVLPGVEIVHVRNPGVAFGFLPEAGAVVVVLTVVALVALLAYFTLRARRPLLWLPTGLLLGGAVGNLVDRVRIGSVVDFIDLPLWPAFNVADAAIVIGVLALLYVLEGSEREGEGGDEPAAA